MTPTTESTKPSAAQVARANIPTLQATAVVLLPGMKHARSLLEISIRVLEYFHHHAANDSATGKFTAQQKAEPDLVEEAERIRSLLSAFGSLNDKNH